jgi:hypothetical protein
VVREPHKDKDKVTAIHIEEPHEPSDKDKSKEHRITDPSDLSAAQNSSSVPLVGRGNSAGSAGDFKPLKGKKDPFDNNCDKGDTPAKNSTGVPNTPSGAKPAGK